MSDSRFVVGIDLGTTHTVLSYADAHAAGEPAPSIGLFAVPQLVAPGVVEPRAQLPSFLYLAAGPEFPAQALDLPWAEGRSFAVGELAREHGAKVPARLVASAKSWLCHPQLDRTAPILPFQAPEEVPKLSPVDAAARYLGHLRDAWNETLAKDDPAARLEAQELYLTVPASFDAVARELTVRAAAEAGLSSVTLLEEPQAAFYAWLAAAGDSWRQQLQVGDRVLVCDVGGGTTDFSLIAVRDRDGDLELERVAVGEHILLGGDNMDLALAVIVAGRLSGHDLDPWQTRSLWYACRRAKERLLSQPDLAREKVTVLGRGAKVIGASISSELTQEDIAAVLDQGFFPECALSDRPAVARQSGLAELGLPYAQDAAVTRHLAKFLSAHAAADATALPTAVLFNGGVMKADALRAKTARVINQWAKAAGGGEVTALAAVDFDTAVAQGAAYYGLVRRGKGVRIRGGVARTYYIGIESAMPAVPGLPTPLKALCVVPFGMEEGTEADVEGREFGMVVGEPVEFRFLSSTTRKDDALGTLIERWTEGELAELSPVQTAMRDATDPPGTSVPVKLHSSVTEVGTLDIALRARDGRSWKLSYDVRERS